MMGNDDVGMTRCNVPTTSPFCTPLFTCVPQTSFSNTFLM